MNALRFASGSPDTIEGLLCPVGGTFNGRDTYGTYFTRNTDFALDWFPSDRPLLWHHGLDKDAGITPIGRITTVEMRDAGLWMQAQLDARNDYYGEIKKLIGAGALGLSSGSMGHLVEIDEASGEIKRWPLVEGTATPTPANLLACVDFATFKSHYRSAGIEVPDETMAQLEEGADSVDIEAVRAKVEAKKSGEDTDPTDDAARSALEGKFEGELAMLRGLIKLNKEGLTQPSDGIRVTFGTLRSILDASDATRANAGSESVPYERSFEDIRDDITRLINPQSAFDYGECCNYAYVVATYADYVIICRYEDGDADYWKIAYSLGDDMEPVLGEATEMEQVYVPVAARMATGPLTLDAQRIARHAAALCQRTQDLTERRLSEGRSLSTGNRVQIAEVIRTLGAEQEALSTLLTRVTEQEANAARAANPTAPHDTLVELELLGLLADC